MVKCQARGVLLGIHEKEFSASCSRVATPKAIFLGDPMRGYFCNIDVVAEIARKKLLGALIALARTRGQAMPREKE
jgi:hypothetical protein